MAPLMCLFHFPTALLWMSFSKQPLTNPAINKHTARALAVDQHLTSN